MNPAKKTLLNEVEIAISNTLKLVERNKNSMEDFLEKSHQLQAILNDLNKIKYQLIKNELPPEKNRFLIYESFIMDWGVRHQLGKELLDIATRYTYIK